MTSNWILIAALATGTYLIRITGVATGQRIPQTGPAARALQALPGTLIVSLVTVTLATSEPNRMVAAGAAAATAATTRSLPLTIGVGVCAAWLVSS